MTDQEIMRGLQAHLERYNCNACPQTARNGCAERLCTEAVSLIERLTAENAALREKVPQWIGVEDRLPTDHFKRYLIAFKDAGGSIVDAARYIPGLGWDCYSWEVPQDLITHWMPLPGAPEEGDKHGTTDETAR